MCVSKEHQINNKCHIYTSPVHICWHHWSIPTLISSWVQKQPWSLWLPSPIFPSSTVNWGPQMCQALFRVLGNTQCIGYKAKSLTSSCFQSMGVGRRNEAHLPLAFSWTSQNSGHVWDASFSGVNHCFSYLSNSLIIPHPHPRFEHLINGSWWRGLCNSKKLWVMLCKATQDGQVVAESSDKVWSTGGGNGKPLQYSWHKKSINSIKR